ncbi:PQQ-binding-like beta-propeller repeat protein, partial [Planctomycetota bacterium]
RLYIMEISQGDGTHTPIKTRTGDVKERLITLGRYARETPPTRIPARSRTLRGVSANCMAFTADDTFGATWARGRRGAPSSAKLFCKGSREWSVAVSGVRPDAVVLGGETLFVAGGAWDEKTKDLLLAVSPADGSTLGTWELTAPPVPEGVAAAGGRLYLTTTDGTVHCFGE